MSIFKLLWIVALTRSICARKHTYYDDIRVELNRYTYETEKHIVETLFEKCHPKLDPESWTLVDNLTAPVLKDICSQVLYAMVESYAVAERMSYETEATLKERVVRSAPVKLLNGDVRKATLLYCDYAAMDFYLGPGDDTHVFKLSKNDTDDVYYLDSGLHYVNFTYSFIL